MRLSLANTGWGLPDLVALCLNGEGGGDATRIVAVTEQYYSDGTQCAVKEVSPENEEVENA